MKKRKPESELKALLDMEPEDRIDFVNILGQNKPLLGIEHADLYKKALRFNDNVEEGSLQSLLKYKNLQVNGNSLQNVGKEVLEINKQELERVHTYLLGHALDCITLYQKLLRIGNDIYIDNGKQYCIIYLLTSTVKEMMNMCETALSNYYKFALECKWDNQDLKRVLYISEMESPFFTEKLIKELANKKLRLLTSHRRSAYKILTNYKDSGILVLVEKRKKQCGPGKPTLLFKLNEEKLSQLLGIDFNLFKTYILNAMDVKTGKSISRDVNIPQEIKFILRPGDKIKIF